MTDPVIDTDATAPPTPEPAAPDRVTRTPVTPGQAAPGQEPPVAVIDAPVIDVHAHAMPMPVLRWLADRGLADLSRTDDNIVVLDPRISGVGPGAPLPLARSMHDPAERLWEMDNAGVDMGLVSLPPFLFATTCDDPALVAEVVRRGNDALADYCATAPERLRPLGAVPLGWPGAADEARRCLDELGFAGIAIGSRGGGRDLDASVNDPLWSLLSERRTFTFLHPSGVPDPDRLGDFWFPQLVGYPMETAIATARLAFGGVLERTPLVLCLAHGGGCLGDLRGRLDMGWERKRVAHTTSVPPSQLFDRLYYDTAVFAPEALRHLVDTVGAGQVLLGTDHPFDLAEKDPVGFVRSADLGASAEASILGRTAAGLLGGLLSPAMSVRA
ncbi:amidohydrolase family protein [Raineyella sp.]|uniref:amidohydrolase family protein n=1 Tax=Raineyella sp. TaxID=1911550 RepID=UPI002B1E9749|nr:amidohydrolase family protein [Raineyella sp.]MEA5154002.1 amidohydrolase family protein [Raineyella sp.]